MKAGVTWRKKHIWMLGVLLVALGILAATLWAPRRAQPGVNTEVAALSQRCIAEMLRGTCGAMRSSAPDVAPQTTQRVFIAGLGEVDAVSFEALRTAGDDMCAMVSRDCRTAWNGSVCVIAKALFPARLTDQAVKPAGL